jgi:hypothetical protein
LEGVCSGEGFGVEVEGESGVKPKEAVGGGFEFGASLVLGAEEDLALQVREFDPVGVNEAKGADAGGGKVEGDGGAEAAGADAEDPSCFDFFLGLLAKLRNCQVPSIAESLIGGEFWQIGGHWNGLERLLDRLNRNLLSEREGHDFEHLV